MTRFISAASNALGQRPARGRKRSARPVGRGGRCPELHSGAINRAGGSTNTPKSASGLVARNNRMGTGAGAARDCIPGGQENRMLLLKDSRSGSGSNGYGAGTIRDRISGQVSARREAIE